MENIPDWDVYFMKLAELTSTRSSCSKRQVGCVIVKNHRIISTGYNGTPRFIKNCKDGGCERCSNNTTSGHYLDLCICVHAEMNALLYAGLERCENATLYCTLSPCINCTKVIIQCGIEDIVYKDSYEHSNSTLSDKLFQEANITKRQLRLN